MTETWRANEATMADLAHPDGVRRGQPRHEQGSSTRLNVQRTVAIRLQDPKAPAQQLLTTARFWRASTRIPMKVALLAEDVLVVSVMAGLLRHGEQSAWHG